MNLWGILKGLLVQNDADRTKELSVEISSSATTGTRTTLVAAQTANRTVTLPNSTDTLVGQITTNALGVRIDNVESDLAAEITRAQAEEADIRVDFAAADTILQSNITAEASARSSADTTLQTNITNEASTRASADTTLQTNINAKADSSALTAHLSDAIDAHAASAIGFTPYLTIGSTTTQDAINELKDEVDAIVVGGSGANTQLSNLSGTTAIPVDLLPDSTAGARNIGSGAKIFNSVVVRAVGIYGSSGTTNQFDVGGIYLAPDATTTNVGIRTSQTTNDLLFMTENQSVAQDSNKIKIQSGNTANGNSGDIVVRVGLPSGSGTRGKITLKDGSEGTAGHVWTSTDTTGKGGWAAPASSSKGVARSYNLLVKNNVANPTTQIDVTSSKVQLVDASDNAVVIASPGTLTNHSAGAQAAGGRDQAGTFSNQWVYIYYIYNGVTLSTVASANATSPTLPSGYTYYALVSAIFMLGSSFRSVYQLGSMVNYTSLQSLVNMNNTSQLDTPLSLHVAPNSLAYHIDLTGTITANGSGLASAVYNIVSISGAVYDQIDVTLNGLTASSNNTLISRAIMVPNFTASLSHYWTVAVGTSQLMSVKVLGYKLPIGE